jgi:mRNA interferase RelE/StbE
VAYRIQLSEATKQALRALPKELRRNIGYRIDLLKNDLAGDVKRLHGHKNLYRLRVGEYRVLFRLESGIIEVYAVKTRQGAYE